MGMLSLKRLMSTQQGGRRCRRRRQQVVQDRNEPGNKAPEYGERRRDAGPDLPEEIWCHIHSLMPMEDSALAACVSHTFLHSWRHYPYLVLNEETLGLKWNACGKGEVWSFTRKIDQILKNHSVAGVKTLKLDVSGCCDINDCYLNDWLHIAITPRTESITLELPSRCKEDAYNFPCSLLFGENGNLIQHLYLAFCAFRPMGSTGCLRSLTNLQLHRVHITGEELGFLLSSSLALMQLELNGCSEIIYLKIPCMLEQLSYLTVSCCGMLQMIEAKAPNLSTFNFEGDKLVNLSLELLQAKNLDMDCEDETNFLCYAINKLHMVPNLESLTLCSYNETVNIPTAAAKFLHLKYMEIYLGGDISQGYDFLSMGSFLDAAPVLETFILDIDQDDMEFDSVFGNASNMRQRPEHKHQSLKDVRIYGFCSATSMVEFTLHILENATSLEHITLDTVYDEFDEDDLGRCSVAAGGNARTCCDLSNEMILEVHNGLTAIEKYIAGKVASTVKLDVRGPCSRCHTLESR